MDTLPALNGDSPSLLISTVDSGVLKYHARSRDISFILDALGSASAAAQRLPAAITSASRVAADATQRVYVARDAATARALGFLKVGQRTLFISTPAAVAGTRLADPSTFIASLASRGDASARGRAVARGGGALWECAPLCVLDFFVEESARRRGVGRALFDAVLREEGVAAPAALAFVRPRHQIRQRCAKCHCRNPAPSLLHILTPQDRPSAMFLSFLRKHFGLVAFTPQANNFVLFDELFSLSSGRAALSSAPTPSARAQTAPTPVHTGYSTSRPSLPEPSFATPRAAPTLSLPSAREASAYATPRVAANPAFSLAYEPAATVLYGSSVKRSGSAAPTESHWGADTLSSSRAAAPSAGRGGYGAAPGAYDAHPRAARFLRLSTAPNGVIPSARAVNGGGWLPHGARAPGAGAQWTGSIGTPLDMAEVFSLRGGVVSRLPATPSAGAASSGAPHQQHRVAFSRALEESGSATLAARRARFAEGRRADDPWLQSNQASGSYTSPTRLRDRPF